MAVLKRRSHVISIRLSEDEFKELHTYCLRTGARSISDLARESMLCVLGHGTFPESISRSVSIFDSKLANLDKKIERLSAELDSARANGTHQ